MDLLLPSLGVRGYRRPFAFRVHIVNVRRLRYFGGTAGQTGSRTSQSSSRVKNSCYFGLANLSRDCLLCEHFAPEISQTDTHTHRVVVVSRSEGSVTRDATHFLTHGRDAYTHTQTHPTLRHIYTDTHTRKENGTLDICVSRDGMKVTMVAVEKLLKRKRRTRREDAQDTGAILCVWLLVRFRHLAPSSSRCSRYHQRGVNSSGGVDPLRHAPR